MANHDYKYLILFMNDTEWSRKNFLKKYGEKELSYLIKEGLIKKSRMQSDGDEVYCITAKGKQRCNE